MLELLLTSCHWQKLKASECCNFLIPDVCRSWLLRRGTGKVGAHVLTHRVHILTSAMFEILRALSVKQRNVEEVFLAAIAT